MLNKYEVHLATSYSTCVHSFVHFTV